MLNPETVPFDIARKIAATRLILRQPDLAQPQRQVKRHLRKLASGYTRALKTLYRYASSALTKTIFLPWRLKRTEIVETIQK